MTSETDFSLLNWLWSVLSIPLIWMYTRVNRLETKVDDKVTKEEMKEYVDLRLSTIEYKIDTILEHVKKQDSKGE